jgi:hypothetical protein
VSTPPAALRDAATARLAATDRPAVDRPARRVRVWEVRNNCGETVQVFPFNQLDNAYNVARNLSRPGFVVPADRWE